MNVKPETYFIQEYLLEKVYNGSIGNVDIEKILLQNGARAVFFPAHFEFTLKAKMQRLKYLVKMWLGIPNGSVVFFQYPYHAGMTGLLLRLLKFRKGIQFVCLIADINGLKHGNASLLKKEKRIFCRYRYFILHNESMKSWLQSFLPHSNTAQLQFFDFLAGVPGQKRSRKPEVVFAGNLEKSPFLEKLDQVFAMSQQIHFHIYGQPVTKAMLQSSRVVYHGVFDPYELPGKIEGSFGLVWDGSAIDEPVGSMGHYMQYITHHKVSLYILCQLPLIIYEGAGAAALIRQYKIGFTIRHLFEIEEKINSIADDEYEEMCHNCNLLAAKISSGGCLTAAYREIINQIKEEQNKKNQP